MKNKYQIEFLTKEEIETLRQAELTERQIRIIDIMKSWSETRRDADGYFTLSAVQIAEEMKVSLRTINRDLVVIRCKGIVDVKKTRVSNLKTNVNAYRLSFKGDTPMTNPYDKTQNPNDKPLCQNDQTLMPNLMPNEVEMAHSISNSISKSNSIITNNNNSNYTKTNTTISVRQNMKGTINFTFDNFELSYDYETIDELTEITEKAIEIDRRIRQSVDDTVKVNQSTSTERPVTNTMTFNDRLGETWDEIDRELQELKNKPLSVATEMLCVGDNHYSRLVSDFKSFIEENSKRMSSKQYSICQSKLDLLEKSIASKIENCHLYVGKSPEEIAHIKAVKNVEILGDRLSNSSSQEEFDGKREQLIDWCDKKCSENALSERDVEYVQAVLDKAKEDFRTNHENESNTSTDEATLDNFIDGQDFMSSISTTDIQSVIQPSTSIDYPFA